MADESEIEALREQGVTPKAIARKLGLRPAEVTVALQRIAARKAEGAGPPKVVGCWVNEGWSTDLGFPDPISQWSRYDVRAGISAFPGGFAQVLVAREGRYQDVVACGYLVDVWCLGVKDTLGPVTMKREELNAFGPRYFTQFDAAGPIPIEVAQGIVLGAAAYARQLGFEPHPDFAKTEAHLGIPDAPSSIVFGRNGRPDYAAGARDDSARVLATLRRAVGEGNFDTTSFLAKLPEAS